MPRYRGTKEGTASLVGKVLLLIAGGQETSATLAGKLRVSPRQVNRYIVGLKEAGWQIERRGVPTHRDYWLEMCEPRIVWQKRAGREHGKNI
jgi:biotin operon repressor